MNSLMGVGKRYELNILEIILNELCLKWVIGLLINGCVYVRVHDCICEKVVRKFSCGIFDLLKKLIICLCVYIK